MFDSFNVVHKLHNCGPYGNLRDKNVLHYIGQPLVKLNMPLGGGQSYKVTSVNSH